MSRKHHIFPREPVMSSRRLGDPPLLDELFGVLFPSLIGSGFAISETILVFGVFQRFPPIISSEADFIDIPMELGILLDALGEELDDIVEAGYL